MDKLYTIYCSCCGLEGHATGPDYYDGKQIIAMLWGKLGGGWLLKDNNTFGFCETCSIHQESWTPGKFCKH